MNSFFESNDLISYQSSIRPDLRFPTYNSNFSSNLNDTNLGLNQNIQAPRTSSPICFKNQFSNFDQFGNNNNNNNNLIKNDNQIGVYNTSDCPNMVMSQKSIQTCYTNDSNSSFMPFNNSNFNTYLNNVSLQIQNEHNNNENLIKFNLFQQLANETNLKSYPNLNFINNQTIENNSINNINNINNNNNSNNNNSSNNLLNKNYQLENNELKLINQNLNQVHLIKDIQKPKKVKKSRILFSQWQINELEKLFKKQKYVTSNERELMAKRLKLQANQVKIWFQNRRYKIKKQNETAQQKDQSL